MSMRRVASASSALILSASRALWKGPVPHHSKNERVVVSVWVRSFRAKTAAGPAIGGLDDWAAAWDAEEAVSGGGEGLRGQGVEAFDLGEGPVGGFEGPEREPGPPADGAAGGTLGGGGEDVE